MLGGILNNLPIIGNDGDDDDLDGVMKCLNNANEVILLSTITFQVANDATEWTVPDLYIFPPEAVWMSVNVEQRRPILMSLPLDRAELEALRPITVTLRPA